MAYQDLSDPVVQLITEARVKLLFTKPFFGTLSTRLDLVDASKWCNTAATDGKRLYYNREFIKGLTKPQLLFLLGHEVLHCVYDHFGRRGSRDPKLWNMANDYIVNYTLRAENVGVMPDQGLYDAAYSDEMSSEEVYDLLKKNSVTVKMTLDEHIDLADDDEDQRNGKSPQNGDGTVDVTIIGKDGPPKLTADDLQKIRNDLRSAVIQAAQTVGAGKLPAGIRRMIEELIEPKMDWRSMLDAHIRSSVKDDYTFSRISRRSWGSGFVLPAQNFMDTIDIAISIDYSGSMSAEMLRDFLSEVKGIMETFRDFKIKLWTFDTKVAAYREFGPENLHEIEEYEGEGGGGTLFECNWEFMKENGIEPQRFVLFTDGYPNSTWGDEGYCDTLFIVHGSKHIEAPFGLTAHYEPSDD